MTGRSSRECTATDFLACVFLLCLGTLEEMVYDRQIYEQQQAKVQVAVANSGGSVLLQGC